MLKAIIFDMDTEWKLAKQSILTNKKYYPLPGLRQILQALAQDKIRLTIISTLPQQELIKVCHSAEIMEYFQHLVSVTWLKYAELPTGLPASDNETKHIRSTSEPPALDNEAKCIRSTSKLLALALQKNGVLPTEVLLVTDSDSGTRAAKAAALPCIAFRHPHSEKADLWHADILLESFDGLSTSFFFQVYNRFHDQPITIASTRRLWIRELTIEDIPVLCAIYENPNIRRFITDIEDCIEDEAVRQTAYINTVYRFYGYGLWGIFHKNSGTLIGRCGIENHKIAGKEEIMLSYLLDSNHWGHGYALEACKATLHYAQEELDMHRIIAVIDYENKRSLRTAANLGMKFEQELIHKNRRCFLFALEQ